MPHSKPLLYVFAISHFCEKARWALDYLGVDYDLKFVMPGEHGKIARQLGASGTSVPYLSLAGQVIQGSGEIIDWADKVACGRHLTPAEHREACLSIENRLDTVAGVHIRRYYYSEALVEHPETVRPIFTHDLPLMKQAFVSFAWNKIRGIMIKRMDLGAEQGLESRKIVERELDWVDGLLAGGRKYLVGDTFSRADIVVASLLAPLVLPAEHPTYGAMKHPPRLAEDVLAWKNRPSLEWVRETYAKHRQPDQGDGLRQRNCVEDRSFSDDFR